MEALGKQTLKKEIIDAVKTAGPIPLDELALQLKQGKIVSYIKVDFDFRILVLEMVADNSLILDKNFNLASSTHI